MLITPAIIGVTVVTTVISCAVTSLWHHYVSMPKAINKAMAQHEAECHPEMRDGSGKTGIGGGH